MDELLRLLDVERLGEKKAQIYSRLLTDVSLSELMKDLKEKHHVRVETLRSLIFGGEE